MSKRYYEYDTLCGAMHDVVLKNGAKHRCIDEGMILELPQADVVERKRGKWEGKKVFDGPFISQWQSARCSACGKHHATPFSYYFFDYKYCPYCGADMREEKAR